MRNRKFHVSSTPEFLRDVANRDARRIGSYGWRPTQKDLAELKASTGDAIAYRVAMRSWHRATGFRMRTLKKLAGRGP
jgi:hypothetical protein